MKIKYILAATLITFTIVGCASTPSKTEGATANNAVSQEKVEKKTKKKPTKKVKGITFATMHDVDTTRSAIVSALKLNGFNVDATDKGLVITAARPHKMGLIAGSGGEKITVKMSETSPTETQVHIRTKKTLLGYAVQKNWDDEVAGAIKTKLTK